MQPNILDTAGVRKDGAGGESANKSQQGKFIRAYATETLAKGDWVALDFNATEPANGWGQYVKKCDMGAGTTLFEHACGVVVEGATVSGSLTPEVVIQVAGINRESKIASALGDGLMLAATTTAGVLALRQAGGAGDGDDTAVCILVKYSGNANVADSTTFLINPLNL